MPKGFFKVDALSSNKVRLNINGVIGDWGNSSEDVIYQIENADVDEIEVVIQSPGGSAFEGIAIYNALKNHPAHVVTRVLGAAASAASIIFMAGDERIMPVNTYLMIHEPSLAIRGKAKELREAADFLENLTDALVSTYAPYVNIDSDEVLDLVQKETWLKASLALEHGFATQTEVAMEAVALSNEFSLRFEHLPDSLSQKSIDDTVAGIQSMKDFESCLRDSGCSKKLATALVSKAKTIFQSDSGDELKAIFNTLNNFTLE